MCQNLFKMWPYLKITWSTHVHWLIIIRCPPCHLWFLTCKSHSFAAHEAPIFLGFGGVILAFFTGQGDYWTWTRTSGNRLANNCRPTHQKHMNQVTWGAADVCSSFIMSVKLHIFNPDKSTLTILSLSHASLVLGRSSYVILRKPLAGCSYSGLFLNMDIFRQQRLL